MLIWDKMKEQEIINNISASIFNREYNDLKETIRKLLSEEIKFEKAGKLIS